MQIDEYLFSDEYVHEAIQRANIDELATIWSKAPYVRRDVDLRRLIENNVEYIAEKNRQYNYTGTFAQLVREIDQNYTRQVKQERNWVELKKLMLRGSSWRRFIMRNLNRSDFNDTTQDLVHFANLVFTGTLLAYRDRERDSDLERILSQYRFQRDAREPDFQIEASENIREYRNGIYSYIAFLREFLLLLLAENNPHLVEYVLNQVSKRDRINIRYFLKVGFDDLRL